MRSLNRHVAALLCGGLLVSTTVRADEIVPPSAPEAQAEAAAPEPAQRKGELSGYKTEKGAQLPLLQYEPYQGARQKWLAGFITTMGGAGLVATGIGVLLVGSQATGSLTEDGQRNSMVAGGVMLGLGVAAAAAGATFWYLGRRDIGRIEKYLQRYDGPQSLTPAAALIPDGAGGASGTIGLSGKF